MDPSFNHVILGFGFPLAAQSNVKLDPLRTTEAFGGMATKLGDFGLDLSEIKLWKFYKIIKNIIQILLGFLYKYKKWQPTATSLKPN